MANVFVTSDTHFGHANICKFLREDGSKVRPWDDVDEMDKALIHNWNSKVGPKDKVYHLGDVFINRKARFILDALNGDKVLIRGNHDIFTLEHYVPYFRDIRGYHVLDNILLSHIPIHSESLGRFKGNVHGHLHTNVVMDKWNNQPDKRYKSVCVELTNYAPVELSELQQYFDKLLKK